jgi:hypothetical protein
LLSHFRLDYEYLDRSADVSLPEVPANVRGILDVEDKVIYAVDEKLIRQRWVIAHEIGHWVLHDHLFRWCSGADLEPTARKQLEREANEFGATLLFQGTRFTNECLRLPFSLDMLRERAREWKVSNEAAFRRFTEQNSGAVALAVCRPIGAGGSAFRSRADRASILERGVELTYWTSSPSYRHRGLDLARRQTFSADHVITQAMSSGRSDHYGRVTIGKTNLPMSMFFTSWSALVIIGLSPGDQISHD